MHKYLTPSYLTKPGALVLCLSLLVGCTSVQQRKDWSQKKFGPRCESVGYKADTPAYLDCIADEDRTWRINQMEKGTPYENWMPMTYLPSITDEKR